MKLRKSFAQSLKDNRVVFLMLCLALVGVTAAYYLVLGTRDLDQELINNRILLFFLRNVNAVLIAAVIFVLIRNLLKLWVERRRKRLGSKFQTKLVATYIGLSLLPLVLLFFLATGLVQGSLDRLFDAGIDDLLEPGYEVTQTLTSTFEERNRRDAGLVDEAVAGIDIESPEELPALSGILQSQMNRFGLDLVFVYLDTDFVHALVNPQGGLSDLPEVGRTLLLEALREGEATRVQRLAGRPELLVLGARAGDQMGSGQRRITVVGTVMDAELVSNTEALVGAFQQRRQLDVLEPEIRAVNLLTLLMVTLVLLLACTWVGLYLARRVTVPIEALAEGTRHIISGDLDYRVEEAADDELGVLVTSFNRMTGELQRNKEVIEKSNAQLLETNQRLDEERAWTETVLQNVAAGVVSVDADGRVQTINSAAVAMLGLGGLELVGRDLLEALSDRSTLIELFSRRLSAPEPTHEEVHIVLGGDWKTFDVSSTPLYDEQRTSLGQVIVIEDLTELIKAQQLATWNDAARRIAHEIKNPLTPIKLSAERALKKHREQSPDFGATLERSVEIITREVGNMKSMVDEFSRFARMPHPQPSAVDLRRLIDDTVALYRDIKPGLEVESHVSDDTPELASLDGEQMRSALINLLDNAVEATPEPGRIDLHAERSNGVLRIQVKDTGAGISADAKEKLFLPYYSTKGRGTGLGLAIVHRVVTDHRGSIRVEDNQPTGSVFTIELPQE